MKSVLKDLIRNCPAWFQWSHGSSVAAAGQYCLVEVHSRGQAFKVESVQHLQELQSCHKERHTKSKAAG